MKTCLLSIALSALIAVFAIALITFEDSEGVSREVKPSKIHYTSDDFQPVSNIKEESFESVTTPAHNPPSFHELNVRYGNLGPDELKALLDESRLLVEKMDVIRKSNYRELTEYEAYILISETRRQSVLIRLIVEPKLSELIQEHL